jgi:hypothetical protein
VGQALLTGLLGGGAKTLFLKYSAKMSNGLSNFLLQSLKKFL